MLAITIRFPAGRYHATPWGRHVNEAAIAWPPEPLRLFRALVAAWHRKLDPVQFPRADLAALLASLVDIGPPVLRLPSDAIHAHTRHYMPTKGGKTTLVFDAFARLSPEDPVVFAWPELSLTGDALALLDALLEAVGYFGRAESWAVLQREDWQGGFNCVPVSDSPQTVDPDTGEILGQIARVLTPLPPAAYQALRTQRLAGGGKPSAKLQRSLPESWLEALEVDTATLQSAGWSQPPIAHTVAYRVQAELQTVARRVLARPKAASDIRPTTARFMLYGKPLPRAESALSVGEAFRLAAMGRAKRLFGEGDLPPELCGHGLADDNRHGHAFWLPEPNERGELDHVLVHAPGGFSAQTAQALTALRFVRWGDGDPLQVVQEGMGSLTALAGLGRLTGESAVWRSVTPYMHPWYLKAREMRTPQDRQAAVLRQLQKEWQLRGEPGALLDAAELPTVDAGGRRLMPLHFQRQRRKRGLSQPDSLGRFVELLFSQPVRGPLALGFGSHFGLGLFVPILN